MTKVSYGCLSLLCALASPWAGAARIDCPETLTPEEHLAMAPPAGWQVRGDSRPRYLESVGFYDGDPTGEASLAPLREADEGGEGRAEWDFVKDPAPVWMACRYWTVVSC